MRAGRSEQRRSFSEDVLANRATVWAELVQVEEKRRERRSLEETETFPWSAFCLQHVCYIRTPYNKCNEHGDGTDLPPYGVHRLGFPRAPRHAFEHVVARCRASECVEVLYPPRRDCQFSRNGRKTSRFDGRQTNVSATVPLHSLQRGARSRKRRIRARGSGGENCECYL